MAECGPSDVTTLLREIRAGNAQAKNRLASLIYDELHHLAAGLMRHERAGHSLQPTALLHETFVRLLGGNGLAQAPNRAALFGLAARAMRKLLADHARRRNAIKRGGDRQRVPFDSLLDYCDNHDIDVLGLDEGLERLAEVHDRASQVLTLRFFGGFTMAEIADRLEVSLTTAEADFRFARAWLRRFLGERP